MNSFSDYYAILGVAVDAPPVAIKAAFKKLALQYHPDIYKGEDAQERMRVLLEAYQTLNDVEARRRYDARRSEHIQDGSIYRREKESASVMGARPRMSVSPGARRDRQRHYDFPDIFEGRPLTINLIDFSYTLSPADARILQQQGIVRGVTADDENCYCHRCHHRWRATGKKSQLVFCPHCRATDWGEYLLLRCIHCAAVFESEQIRYEVGSINYGKVSGAAELCPPYELFPLCPYCGTARWCPVEDARVNDLRVRAASRAAAMRTLWISAVVVLVLVVGVMAFVFR